MRPGKPISIRLLFAGATLALTLSLASLSPAATVTLNDGRSWEGTIVRETKGTVVVKTAGGEITIDRASIRGIDRAPTRREQYEAKLAALDEKDADQQYLLGLWCRKNGLSREADYHLNYACALEPDHEGARQALGQVKYQGKWMPEADAKAAMGLKFVDGRWMTKEAADLAEAEALKRDLTKQVAKRVDALADAIANPKTEKSKRDAEDALAAMRDPFAAGPIMALARHKNADVRKAALRAGDRTDATGIAQEALLHALYDEDPYVRERGRKILAKRWDDAMWPETLKALRDPDVPAVRFAAALLVGVVRPTQAVDPLIEAIYVPYRVRRSEDGSPALGIRGYQTKDSGGAPLYSDPTAGVVGAGPGGTWRPLDVSDDPSVVYLINYAALDALRAMTMKDFGLNKKAWRDWWRDAKDGFKAFKPEK
jgi:hypothetical protein